MRIPARPLVPGQPCKRPAWQILEMAAFAIPTRGGWLAAPIVGRNAKTIGLIELADKQDGDFTEDDEAILVQLSRLAAIAIENAKLYEELKETTAQGRVPGDARARAEKPARRHRQCRRSDRAKQPPRAH